MTITLRPEDQVPFKSSMYQSWQRGNKNVLGIANTGFGKSVVMSDIILDHHNIGQKCAVMAHRNELVSQMSCHVANRGIPHRIIGSDKTISQIYQKHRKNFGKSFINPSAPTAVIGVDTMISRQEDLKDWARQIDCWLGDEHHHCIGNWKTDSNGNPIYKSDKQLDWRTIPNKWGKAVSMFTNARGAGFTATPQRADGQGLGWDYDGVYHDMVIGPPMRDLINRNCLSDFEIACPESDMQYEDLPTGKEGDWTSKSLRKAAKKSHIVGDVVENYIMYAGGRKAIVFATDVETANEIAKKFNDSGIRAVSLNGKSDPNYRDQSLDQFENGEVDVLVNVDLFDEGLDIKGAEVCIMARPTTSLSKYLQMVGRVLRWLPGKIALIIDHVSNIIRHGLPDKYRVWTLARRDKRAKQNKDPDDIPLTVCRQCKPPRPYEAFRTVCPYCGAQKPLPAGGTRTIEQVEGDLVLLDRETLARMRSAAIPESAADIAARVAGVAGPYAAKGVANKQIEKIAAHEALKNTIAQWAGYERVKGYTDSEIMRRFYLTLGTDILGALDASRSRQEMEDLSQRIRGWYERIGGSQPYQT